MYIKNQYGDGSSDSTEDLLDWLADSIEDRATETTQDAGVLFNSASEWVDDETELVNDLRQKTVTSDVVNGIMEEIGNGSTWSVKADSLAGTMRGYDAEQAKNAFENHGFNLHVIASYQSAEHTSLYDWSAASMRRITNGIENADWQLHIRLFEWYDSNFNEWNVDVYTHTEATPIHKNEHLSGEYWECQEAIKMVKHIMPQWNYTYDEFDSYAENVEAFVSNFQGYPFT